VESWKVKITPSVTGGCRRAFLPRVPADIT
jgi:hypothetical protein